MNHIIIEGMDRLGKSTIVRELSKDFSKVFINHFGVPKGDDNEEKLHYQILSFTREFDYVKRLRSLWHGDNGIALWDRSHLGEAVYGPLYRNSSPEFIHGLEKLYEDENTFLFLLEAPIEFIANKDDGDSLSKNKKELLEKERDLFRDAFHKSKIKNKAMIQVADTEYFKLSETVERIKKVIINARRK